MIVIKSQDTLQRAGRLESRIRKIIATEIEQNLKDPILKAVTITEVKLTGDLQNATIYWTLLGDDEQIQITVVKLNRAKGRLRKVLADNLTSRLTPTIEFKYDTLNQQVHSIEELLANAQAADFQVQQQRLGKNYAGDSNPYKVTHQVELVVDTNADVDTDSGTNTDFDTGESSQKIETE